MIRFYFNLIQGQMDDQKEFDFIRNDRFYDLSIPSYFHLGESVYYQIHLKDLVQGRKYSSSYRFNQLKLIHENLQSLKIELPQFPKTHFWKKTNKNPKMIEERRLTLEKYFNIVINDTITRASSSIKNFIRHAKTGNIGPRTYSFNIKRSQNKERSKSLTRNNLSATQINYSPIKK